MFPGDSRGMSKREPCSAAFSEALTRPRSAAYCCHSVLSYIKWPIGVARRIVTHFEQHNTTHPIIFTIMLSFRPSAPQPHFYSPLYPTHRCVPSYPVYLDEDYEEDYSPFASRRVDPEARYRQALAEYLAAEQEYKEVIRAREEAAQRARAEALLREQARLRHAQIARTQRELQAREYLQALANARAQALAQQEAARREEQAALPHISFVIRGAPEQPQRETSVPDARDVRPSAPEQHAQPQVRAERTSVWEDLLESLYGIPSQPSSEAKEQPEPRRATKTGVTIKENAPEATKPFIPGLEALIKERLQKVAGDEELQDVARAILRRLDQHPGVASVPSTPDASCATASSSKVTLDSMAQSTDGADLYRSDALQGTAAEAAKASFQAHRADTAESIEAPATPTTPKSALAPLAVIKDIRTALAKLSADFSLPSSLDFSDNASDGLAYTPTNAPVRAYEHALDKLLAQLDAVESDGDEEVRGVRREAVKEVEQALEDVEKKVQEARRASKADAEAPVETTVPEVESAGKQTLAPVQEPLVDDKSAEVVPSVAEADASEAAEVPVPSGLSDADSSSSPIAVPAESAVTQEASEVVPLEAVLPQDDATPASPREEPPAQGEVALAPVDNAPSPVEPAPEAPAEHSNPTSPGPSGPASPDAAPESPEVASPTLGSIPPTSTPAPVPASSTASSESLASFSSDQFSFPAKPKSSVVTVEDADSEDGWSEVDA
ncbi:hypothetical protein BC834DRAFT_520502 [Gloeopeniophorella convolvens]|nr:hypothetical protein BC834DRAFT_520502 [Gloeopeniophorella convolvens]